MKRRHLIPLAVAALVGGFLLPAPAASAFPTLPIPSPLTASWTAPAGTFAPAAQVNATCTCTLDLSAATIVGSGTGYIVKPLSGSNLTVRGGTVSSMQGLVVGVLGAGGRASVTVDGTHTTNVIGGVFYKTNDGGRLDVAFDNVVGTGFGAGVRTWGSIEAHGDDLTGGSQPSSGDPAGFHAEDLNATGTPVADQLVTLVGNRLHGFTSAGFQGDGAIAEETVARFVAQSNTIGGNSDAALDSKAQTFVATLNTFETGGAGSSRNVAIHWGIGYSVGNAYAVQPNSEGIEATAGHGADPTHPDIAGAVSNGDTFTLADSTALVAKSTVACTGSTGFLGPRAGNLELDHPTWTPAGGTPWLAQWSACTGTSYFPVVTYRP